MNQHSQTNNIGAPYAGTGRFPTQPEASVQTDRVLGIHFANVTFSQGLNILAENLNDRTSTNLFFINAHCLNVSFEDPEYREVLKQTPLIFPDGSGIRRGCTLQGIPLRANLNGTDLFPELCRLLAEQGKSLYLLGATPGTVEKVADWATQQFPGLRIAGTQHGFFSQDDEPAIIEAINSSDADVLCVAMGVPLQEKWLHRNRSRLNTKLNLAVGGLFDFYAGNVSRAPLLFRQHGVEWVWRLMQEPKRMWRRYLLGNPLYALRLRYEARTRELISGFHDQIQNRMQRTRLSFRASFRRLAHRWSTALGTSSKRSTDIFLSIMALICLSPLFALVAIAIRLDSPGPIFYQQQRAGYRGRAFSMWKFRSMCVDAEKLREQLEAQNEIADGVTFKMRNDPRVTRVGRFIRKYSIDELPQLFNVLRGDMSIVGPRPGLFNELTKYELSQRQRLDIKPGLTSEWVVAGRNDLSFAEQAELDIQYRNQRTLWRDIVLMLKTVPALIRGSGAS
ncbi:MAG: WecB/TagA/CpsF family glycosyltransferase [Marinobacter adhaerens]|uniref:WecB/TagA/CpsF family glycosyltransferase n=1 Tax=Marinobacter adhaerens TaxID=1033846 RepID=A0A844I7Y3_9GAMM|nr:WecB/TagA/CpsF family glycosyltransferase [Marinobacter adhaerens]